MRQPIMIALMSYIASGVLGAAALIMCVVSWGPALVIAASYDSGKFERVRFGAVGEDSFARRDGEETVAKLDRTAMADALKAFDAVTIPPSTDTKADTKK